MWSRPVPLIGDPTSALERSADPQAWAFPPEQRDALHQVIAARRDIRRFRPDPVPEDTLRRVLGAAHAAPSVGHSQPWRFIVVQEAATRERAALLADAERVKQAAQLTPQAGRRLLDLQLEGIREAPLGVVVCCDRRAAAAGVLGRATFPDADLWSCACAIENLWLAARAEGLGLGWVTLFRPEDLGALLNLPDGVVTLGWLCLGWPDERPPSPGLERAGWSRRLRLDDVLLNERWPDPAADPGPAAPISLLPTSQFPASALPTSELPTSQSSPSQWSTSQSLISQLRAPGPQAVVAVRDAGDRLLTPPGSLGVLDRALDRVLALGVTDLAGGRLILVGADHPVTSHGVSAFAPEVTTEVLNAAVAGQAMGAAAARAAGLTVRVVDAGVGDRPVTGALDLRPAGRRGDLVGADALTADDVAKLISAGARLGRAAATDGVVVALGEVGVGNTTVAAALTAVLLGRSIAARGGQAGGIEGDGAEGGLGAVVGLGAGADSAMLIRKAEVVAAALARAERAYGTAALRAPTLALQALGGAEFAVLAGVTLGAAEAGGVVVLDGLATCVGALLAVRLVPAVAAHLVAGHRSREAAHALVLAELGQEPLLDLRIRAGEGVGACLAVTLLRTALDTRRGTATTT